MDISYWELVFGAGFRVVKVGGPVYRIGVGGGAASSIQVSTHTTTRTMTNTDSPHLHCCILSIQC